MRNDIHALLQAEGALHGARTAANRFTRRVVRRGNARVMGWSNGVLPLGSTIIGARRITVGPGFDAARPVWLEAVTDYAGEVFDPRIRIGDRFTTSGDLHVSAISSITIGDDCLFGSHVYVGDHAHGDYGDEAPSAPSSAPRHRLLRSQGEIVIGDRCWIGDNVVVLGGVTIGDGCVIGANSVVTRSVPSGTVAAGSPASPLKHWDGDAHGWVRAAARRTR